MLIRSLILLLMSLLITESIFSIILSSDYVQWRTRRMYWESTLNIRNKAVSNAVTRSRFDKTMKCIYCFNPKEAVEGKRCAKIRPLIDKLNKHFMKY